MCGICGEFLFDSSAAASPDRLRRMLGRLEHRGPDGEGTFVSGPVGLGMRRLSIIDLAGGQQPIYSEDRSKALVFNGEIYNYVELRESLQKRGHRFATHSDTEVIVHLYEEKGRRCVEDLNGMFAFALWDCRSGELLLARDRVGIKPLYYWTGGGRLLFSSELEALMTSGEIDRELDAETIDDYFSFFYIPGERSIYRSVRKLAPAHTMVWRGGQVDVQRYWQLEYPPAAQAKPQPIEHYVEGYREQLKRSVRMQLRSDVPVGVFLSGGLDSGSLVAAIARTSGQSIDTFTVGFDDPSYDERRYARATSEHYGTRHHEFVITAEDLRRSGELIGHFGEPFGPFTMVQSWAISHYSRDHIKVALAGDGGDELFGGYQTYMATRWARWYLRLPAFVRRNVIRKMAGFLPVSDKLLSLDFKIREFTRGAEMFDRGGNMAWKVIFDDGERRQLFSEEFYRSGHAAERDSFSHFRGLLERVAGATELQQAMYGDLTMFLPDCVLTQTDRMSMAVSQEVRVPILDHELIEFAAGVPDVYKMRGGQTKVLLREAMKGWLPQEVLDKPKTGFSTPVPAWIRGPLREYVTDILSPAALEGTGVFRGDYVERLLREHIEGRADHARRIWSLVNFMLWHQGCYRHKAVAATENGVGGG